MKLVPLYNISIPYGSIKRFVEEEGAEIVDISIPYGSIKSSNTDRANFPVSYISIPYGSIKSYQKIRIKRNGYTISIPYGSIKSLADVRGMSFDLHFNSLCFN